MLGLSAAVIISRLFILVIAFSVHEFAHAWTADSFGDDTPRRQGRLTLNPVSHIDPIGALVLVVAGFGWAKPVQVNPAVLTRRHPAAMMLVALAGPVSNLILALIASVPFKLGTISVSFSSGSGIFPSLSQFLTEFIFINLLLLFFNLIPLFPLDGEKILYYFAPPSLERTMDRIRPYSMVILLGAVFLLPRIGLDVFGWLISTPTYYLFNLLT